MKVLAITRIYPSSTEPTLGPYNHHVVRALSKYCDVRVLSPRPWYSRLKRPQALFGSPTEELNGVSAAYPSYWAIPRVALRSHGSALYRSLRRPVANIHKQFPFDGIFAAWAYPDAAAAGMIAQEYGCPLITRTMGSDVNHLGQDPVVRGGVIEALMRSDRVVTPSSALKDKVVELGIPADQVIVQHNGVNGEMFRLRNRAEARRELGLPIDAQIVTLVSRLSHEKGVDVFVEAMAELRSKGLTELIAVVVGGGADAASVQQLAETRGVSAQIRFCGEQPQSSIPLWIAAGDLLCLPSRREGCPNVVLEALASGRPVVASRVGGVPELLDESNGIMAPSENPAALAEGIAEALHRTWDPQALRDTVESLSWDDIGARYYQLFTEAIEARKGSKAPALVP